MRRRISNFHSGRRAAATIDLSFSQSNDSPFSRHRKAAVAAAPSGKAAATAAPRGEGEGGGNSQRQTSGADEGNYQIC
ncbi:hypothetical protein Droror1_Dr00011968 [Drosera rotundifolia]